MSTESVCLKLMQSGGLPMSQAWDEHLGPDVRAVSAAVSAPWLWSYRDLILEAAGDEGLNSGSKLRDAVNTVLEQEDSLGIEYFTALYGPVGPTPTENTMLSLLGAWSSKVQAGAFAQSIQDSSQTQVTRNDLEMAA